MPGTGRQQQGDVRNAQGRLGTPSRMEMAEMNGIERATENRLHTTVSLLTLLSSA